MNPFPYADSSVRPAVPGDEVVVAQIQLGAWRNQPALGDNIVDLIDADAVVAAWRDAITTPPSGRHRVLIACEGATPVGFAAITPAEVIALEVAADHQRSGHGSRLMSACVDHLRGFGARTISVWVIDGDDARVAFLTSAGFRPEGVARTLASANPEDPAAHTVREVRYGAAL
jgi:GNAT superfamily N-acetyltransferase